MRGNSRRRAFGARRSSFTEEPHALAARAIPRTTSSFTPESLGFDECTDEQRRFRAFLAVFLLNSPSIPPRLLLDDKAQPILTSGVSRLLYSPILLSAQYSDISVLTNMGDHLLQCVTDASDSTHGVPGLRPVGIEGDNEALLLRHLPTGAYLRFRYFDYANPRQRTPPWFYPTHWSGMRRSSAIGTYESITLNAVPTIDDDAAALLAGLVARMSCQSRGEGWAVSRLLHDSLGNRDHYNGSYSFTHLWGSGNNWVMRWSGYGAVPAADVARALTHKSVGINGATAKTVTADVKEVRFRNATLRLEVHRADISEMFGGGKVNGVDRD